MFKGLLDKLYREYNIDQNTSSTIFITLFVFAVGQLLVWLARGVQGRARRKLVRIVFKRSVKSLQSAAQKQGLVFRELADSFSLDLSQSKPLTNVTSSAFNRLAESDSKEVLNAFFGGMFFFWFSKRRRLRARVLDRVRDYADGMKFIFENSKSGFARFADATNRYNNDWSQIAEPLGKALEDIMAGEISPTDPYRFAKEYLRNIVLESQMNWIRTSKGRNYEDFHRKMIIPLRSACRKLDLDEARQLMPLLLKMSLAYINLYHVNKTKKQQYRMYSRSLLVHCPVSSVC